MKRILTILGCLFVVGVAIAGVRKGYGRGT
jgi:hypothetical protein